MEQNYSQNFLDAVRSIVQAELNNLGLLQGQWHLGKVSSVINSKQITAYVDGSTTAQTIASNPSVTFSVNDEIWIIFVNGNSKDKFALCKRAI